MSSWLLLVLLLIPLILSFSLGVISALLIAILFTFIIHFRNLITEKRVIYLFILGSIIIIPIVAALFFFFPDTILSERLINLYLDKDSSGRGRTYEAFLLARNMIEEKSELWGIGLGQVKTFGAEIIRNFYLYPLDHKVFTIPNATAETLAIFGWVGFCLRLLTEIFLFFYTRVWNSYFRMLLFTFMFINQFRRKDQR